MDTILYFYQTKNSMEPVIYSLQDYQLVRIGLTAEQGMLLSEEKEPEKKKWEWPWERRRRKRETGLARRELLGQIESLWGMPCETWCICEPPLALFPGWQFTDYTEERWIERLMRYIAHPHFVVLGNADCLTQVLPRYAQRMKSLRFLLCESEVTEELLELQEELLQEYGIAATIHTLADRTDYRKIKILSAYPCNVLDFSGEEKLYSTTVPAGSVWLDFTSNEEKRRRMELGKGEVLYVSLKKEWKQPQKSPAYLDTEGKNGYNTQVNGEKRRII